MTSRNGRELDLRRDLMMMVGRIAIIIFAVEVHIMVALNQIKIEPPLVDWVDATVLTVIASPIIYYAVARPFLMAARDAESRLEMQLVEMQRLLESNERLRVSLQQASASTADTLERTLQKIGSDLHDGPAQLLTFSMLHLERLKPVAAKAGDKKTFDLEKHRQVLGDVLREVRSISSGLTLPELAGLSLLGTIELVVRRHGELTGITVELATKELPQHPPIAIKATAYRLIQEALSNSYRHGRATRQWVEARGDGGVLTLVVGDDGIGFTAGQPGTGLGIPGMRARVLSLGGDFAVQSQPGGGTCVMASLALEPTDAAIKIGADRPSQSSASVQCTRVHCAQSGTPRPSPTVQTQPP